MGIMKGGIILSPNVIAWAEGNGHAHQIRATRQMLQDYADWQALGALRNLSPEQLHARRAAYARRMALLDKVLG